MSYCSSINEETILLPSPVSKVTVYCLGPGGVGSVLFPQLVKNEIAIIGAINTVFFHN